LLYANKCKIKSHPYAGWPLMLQTAQRTVLQIVLKQRTELNVDTAVLNYSEVQVYEFAQAFIGLKYRTKIASHCY